MALAKAAVCILPRSKSGVKGVPQALCYRVPRTGRGAPYGGAFPIPAHTEDIWAEWNSAQFATKC